MDLRPGYKQTEIGLIPDDWDAVPLGDLFTFKNGLNKAKKYFGYGTPIVNYMDVFRQPGLRLGRIEGRVDVSLAELEAFEVRKGDVFFTRTSETVEEIGVAAAMLDPATDTVFSGFVLRARPTDDRLDDLFKAYCFSPRYFRKQVIARGTYTTRALTNGRSLSAAILAVPPVAEQRAIAEALSDIDAAITNISELVAKKRDLLAGTMQRLLSGQSRLSPKHNQKEEFRDTEIGRIPSDWEIERLGDIVQKGRGIRYGIVQPGEYDRTGRYMIRGQDYSKSKGWATPDKLFRVSAIVEERYKNARVKAGDLIMTIVGYCGHVEIVPDWLDGANLTQTTARLAIGERAIPEFVKAILNSPLGERQVNSFLKGAAQPGLNCADVEKFLVPLPALEEQRMIAAFISDMDIEIRAWEARLEKTRALKQGMMQALLTGRVRLSVRAEALDTLEVAHA